MKRTWKLTAAFFVVSIGLDIGLSRYGHPEFWWHSLPAFDLVYGLLGCGLLIIASKWLGHTFLMKDEDYYEREP